MVPVAVVAVVLSAVVLPAVLATYPEPVQPEDPGEADQITDVRHECRELAVEAVFRQQGQE